MKKKMAANAEKEKNATEQATSKPADKPAEKTDKPSEKPVDKPADKSADKPKTAEKPAEKKDKAPEKEKPVEKKDKPAEKKEQNEKKKEENGKGESSGKTEKPAPNGRPKQNGSNGATNGTVSPSLDSDSLDDDETALFPELAYDDSDPEWEPGQQCPSRSFTRREQVKATRTPETPRPASDKQDTDESKESKVLKLTDSGKDTPSKKSDAKSDTKLDAKSATKSEPKSAAKSDPKSAVKSDTKSDAKSVAKSDAKKAETPKKDAQDAKADAKKEVKESPKKADKEEKKSEKIEVEVVVEIENSGDSEESRKPDTNFSKSRVKVSPYRRSTRLADQTTSSIAANYTGNNTTMEMDITETSSFMDDNMDDSYLSGLRAIRGRRSYKLLKDLPPRSATANRSVRSVTSITVSEQSSRPTAPVVGRKRKPEHEDNISLATEATEAGDSPVAGKRQRLLDRLARPFRRTVFPARRNAEIVGINTDLPLTAPVASTSSFDPETLRLKTAPADRPPAPAPVPAPPGAEDAKRCSIM